MLPILDANGHMTRVYHVEMIFRVQPFARDVVNNELDIWRDPVWLNRTEVYSGDVGRRIMIAHLETPDASSSAYVEDAGIRS